MVSDDFKEKEVNPFNATDLFLYPLKTPENFLIFPGGIEKGQWYEMG